MTLRHTLAAVAAVTVVTGAACSGGDERSAFCDALEDVRASSFGASASFAPDESDAERRAKVAAAEQSLRGGAARAARALVRLEDAAPRDIDDDVRVVVERRQRFLEGLESGDLPMSSPTEATEDAAALARVNVYAREQCGTELPVMATPVVEPREPSSPPAVPKPPTALR